MTRISPRRVYSFSSAFSRTLQVLITMTSASRVVVCRLVSGLLQQSGHALGVVDVHLAAERLDEILSRHLMGFRFRLSVCIRLSPSERPLPVSPGRLRP